MPLYICAAWIFLLHKEREGKKPRELKGTHQYPEFRVGL